MMHGSGSDDLRYLQNCDSAYSTYCSISTDRYAIGPPPHTPPSSGPPRGLMQILKDYLSRGHLSPSPPPQHSGGGMGGGGDGGMGGGGGGGDGPALTSSSANLRALPES